MKGMRVRKADLCESDLSELGSFDVVVNSHVMEHVRCDYMRVIWNLTQRLTEDGVHVLSVPFAGARTIEDLSPDLTPQDRHRRFGHPDHVRAFGGQEFPNQLKAAFGGRFEEVIKEYHYKVGVDVHAIDQVRDKPNFNRLFILRKV